MIECCLADGKSEMRSGGAPLSRAEVEGVLLPLEHARPFTARAFVDPDVFAFEQTHIFGRASGAWLCVGRVDEVSRPGQWIRVVVAGEPLLIVRGADLRLRAFFDVCRHRGASLVARETCGRDSRITCPYHGWTYELDGHLAIAPHTATSFDRSTHGLNEARIDTWRGFLFASVDESAPSLDAYLDDMPPWFAKEEHVGLQSIKCGRTIASITHANWKLIVENFQESHHFPRIHKALEALTPTRDAHTWHGNTEGRRGHWLGGTMTLANDADTVSTDGKLHDRPLLLHARQSESANESEAAKRTVFDAMLFPALFTSLQPDYLLTYRLIPEACDRTEVVASIYFHEAAFVTGFDPRDVYDLWDRINLEDKLICEDQQANAASSPSTFLPSCYALVEEGMHAFDQKVASIHLQHAPKEST